MNKRKALFRDEAISQNESQVFGKILCTGPVSAASWSLMVFFLSVAFLLFLFFGHVFPSVEVTGSLAYDKGVDYLYASSPGTVDAMANIDNRTLSKGDFLLSIAADGHLPGAASARQQLPLLHSQVALQQHRLQLQEKHLARLIKLMEASSVSEVAVQDQRQVVLDTQIKIKELQQNLMALQAQQSQTLSMPVDGRITALLVRPGAAVKQHQLLAAILPTEASLEAELFVPSRAMRSLHPGQQVVLRYASYPWQKYGVRKGRIRSVGNILLQPGAVAYSDHIGHSFYLVKVTLDSVAGARRNLDLKPGMKLTASLMLPEMALWQWIFV